ncbi:MAG: biotin-dependent carboxyltransferase family protein [Acidobacteria bacterium]|nr:biotin-dependent carboxyltransferase family protein [Acidobacteriota bacterium]
MKLLVLNPGVQATLQAEPRLGFRHAGVPSSGPADAVSMALANRLVGNPPHAPCLEISNGPASFRFESAVQAGLVGARTNAKLDEQPAGMHETLTVPEGAVLEIGAMSMGARVYLSVRGGFEASAFIGSRSTYTPAGFGGFQGRALAAGDRLEWRAANAADAVSTPLELRLWPTSSYALRAVAGPDAGPDRAVNLQGTFRITGRTSRMGAELSGDFPAGRAGGLIPSSAVFPGALQVTPEGRGFLLLADGQTTGGYPHLLQVVRADRHLLGQLRPGDSLRFLTVSQVQAEEVLRAKQALLARWIPDFRL